MGSFDAAVYLAGVTQVENSAAKSPTNVHVISGEVVEKSADGKVLVNVDGMVFAGDDSQYIEISTLGGLQEGDTATIMLAGEEGHSMVPLAIGGIGSVDRINTIAEAAQEAADYAQESAEAAALDAERAKTSAEAAASEAATAKSAAEQAVSDAATAKSSADQAISDAAVAKSSADQAISDAAVAKKAADDAAVEASAAKTSAAAAETSASEAKTSATQASAEAKSATISANAAIRQLSEVENVLGTIDWITEHGTYSLTKDSSIQDGKVYYTRSGSGGASDPYLYTAVSNPVAENLGSYYELSIDTALSNYVASHLALTDDGLYVLKDNSSYKVLLSSLGLQIQDPSGNIAADYGATGTSFSSTRQYYIGNDDAYILFTPATATEKAKISIGGGNVLIGSDKKLSDVLTSLDVSTSQTSTGATITVNGQTVTLSNGQDGAKGDKGDTGPQGPTGPSGEDAAFYATCDTAAATVAKVATISPATTSFTLTPGKMVNVKFTATNSGAVGSLTLNVNNTGAKGIRYRLNNGGQGNLPAPNYIVANQVHKFMYDGTYWLMDVNYNTDTVNRTRMQNVIKAATAITAGRIICGTSAGYKNIGANIAFDLSYPLLYAGSAIAANGTGDNNYLQINGINASANGTITSGTNYVTLYLTGTISGNTFTISAAPFLTTVVPTETNGLTYIPLGVFYNSTTAIYFNSSSQLYAYSNGAFGPVSIREASAAQAAANNAKSIADNAAIIASNANDLAGSADALAKTLDAFVSQHVVVRNDGMYVIPNTGGYYIRLTSDGMYVHDPNGETVAKYGSDMQLGNLSGTHLIANGSRLSFVASDGAEVAYITVDADGQSVFYMNRAVVVNELRFGKWKWYDRNSGNLSLKWIG